MTENLPTNVQLDTNQNGSVSFATDVVATIAGLAATEVEGVASMVSGGGMLDILGRRGQSTRNLTRGVKVEVQDGQVNVQVSIIIDYGIPVPEVAANIQENVKKAIETMSGLTVANVDVHVQGVSFEREMRATAEIEMQQRILLQKREEEQQEREKELERESEPEPEDEPEEGAEPAQAISGQDEQAKEQQAEEP
ncbi:MAG TPA: Asp23/Gls24 family envelope stress response protein [Candidatus Excrementavichristensenella intestinipullorum]|nr:Asp23/Gls24 family envelope stress response protein [Candidatus Excrementavichristensenella intestinipullorum]